MHTHVSCVHVAATRANFLDDGCLIAGLPFMNLQKPAKYELIAVRDR